MKRTLLVFTAAILLFAMSSFQPVKAQEEDSPFSVGTDIVSSYVWRGSAFSGSSFQPYVEYGSGGFSLGAWGSFDFVGSFAEADLYAAYAFDFGLSIGLTDYYYPGTPYFEFDDSTGSHAFELNVGYAVGGFSIGANYILNEAPNAGSIGGDMYFELGYGFDNVDIFVGAGNGWHTIEEVEYDEFGAEKEVDDEFGVVNVGVASSKEIKISESFSLPVGVAAIWNPYAEQFYIVGTISF